MSDIGPHSVPTKGGDDRNENNSMSEKDLTTDLIELSQHANLTLRLKYGSRPATPTNCTPKPSPRLLSVRTRPPTPHPAPQNSTQNDDPTLCLPPALHNLGLDADTLYQLYFGGDNGREAGATSQEALDMQLAQAVSLEYFFGDKACEDVINGYELGTSSKKPPTPQPAPENYNMFYGTDNPIDDAHFAAEKEDYALQMALEESRRAAGLPGNQQSHNGESSGTWIPYSSKMGFGVNVIRGFDAPALKIEDKGKNKKPTQSIFDYRMTFGMEMDCEEEAPVYSPRGTLITSNLREISSGVPRKSEFGLVSPARTSPELNCNKTTLLDFPKLPSSEFGKKNVSWQTGHTSELFGIRSAVAPLPIPQRNIQGATIGHKATTSIHAGPAWKSSVLEDEVMGEIADDFQTNNNIPEEVSDEVGNIIKAQYSDWEHIDEGDYHLSGAGSDGNLEVIQEHQHLRNESIVAFLEDDERSFGSTGPSKRFVKDYQDSVSRSKASAMSKGKGKEKAMDIGETTGGWWNVKNDEGMERSPSVNTMDTATSINDEDEGVDNDEGVDDDDQFEVIYPEGTDATQNHFPGFSGGINVRVDTVISYSKASAEPGSSKNK
ncbi:hypothetical protein DFH27DRAFT_607917 [Peziza echinospora]|nr:hypothetical protein DFH27DRAFT_607917 [Peziza echinospora]